ncbi:MAG: tetratricopeptide repeat protein [Marinilabiliales bacterium]|nr:tetratricopeptide repeat protein [Marinilabiliales bacterium]
MGFTPKETTCSTSSRIYERSIEALEKAIALDPGFATAYRKMAAAFEIWAGPYERAKYLQKASGIRATGSPRERGSWSRASCDERSESPSTRDRAIEAYKKLLDLYPDSREAIAANNNLGAIYRTMEDWGNAIKHFEAGHKGGLEF